MGRASHKQAGSYISIQTLMPAGELLGLAETIALQVFKRRADKPGPVVVTGRGAASIDFAVTNLWQKAIMRFRVSVAPATWVPQLIGSLVQHSVRQRRSRVSGAL